MSVRFVDELDGVLGWIEDARVRRTSHALAAEGRVWIVDPIEADDVDERILALGEPVAVIQLLDRHERDCAAFAARFGVPLHVVPRSLSGSPFELRPVVSLRFWREVALWWPERRILVCADVLGTVPFFRAGDEPVGMHPLLRLWPPRGLRGLDVRHALVGHGEGVADGAAVERALTTARRRLPRWLAGVPRIVRRGY
jgi:hypothetical protein